MARGESQSKNGGGRSGERKCDVVEEFGGEGLHFGGGWCGERSGVTLVSLIVTDEEG